MKDGIIRSFVEGFKDKGGKEPLSELLGEAQAALTLAAVTIPIAVQERIFDARDTVTKLKAKVDAL